MMLNRPRTLGAIAGLFSGALLLAGCGQPASTPAAPTLGAVNTPATAAGIAAGDSNPQQADESVSKATGETARESSGAGSGHQSITECAASDFAVDLTVQPNRPGVLLMAVTNKSKQDCHVNGWADIAPVDMSGKAHTEVPVQKVEIPGGPTEVTLNPGETAFAGVLVERGDKADPNTVVATGFSVSVPGVDGPVNANIVGIDGTSTENGGLYAEFPLKSMKAGTLQPTTQGVTVF
ncbi:Protein of unknown function [Saccharopolyspora shandongensis]|uniref:DUF4232 domain-containing protein n=1 Tax=Saccharopolyspora shandongensis TaxID=418495 RepID=A0A1H3U744_9PSEU|nr:DUF4232 domain-containing protein [Saccharopolyspora shandongensis]SDZ58323.1 Protein of unknown function [Saccharopolyspora shandongensis]